MRSLWKHLLPGCFHMQQRYVFPIREQITDFGDALRISSTSHRGSRKQSNMANTEVNSPRFSKALNNAGQYHDHRNIRRGNRRLKLFYTGGNRIPYFQAFEEAYCSVTNSRRMCRQNSVVIVSCRKNGSISYFEVIAAQNMTLGGRRDDMVRYISILRSSNSPILLIDEADQGESMSHRRNKYFRHRFHKLPITAAQSSRMSHEH